MQERKEKGYAIVFPQPFTTVPKVIASLLDDLGHLGAGETFDASIRSLTSTTSFTINMMGEEAATGWSQQLRVNWQAWQKIFCAILLETIIMSH